MMEYVEVENLMTSLQIHFSRETF
jgi:hypothetical protein